MSILLSARDLGHSYGAHSLFKGVSFTVSAGDRIGLIGPNGAGKSTLLKILAGELSPDDGDVARRGALRLALLPQIPYLAGATIREAVRAGLPDPASTRWEDDARVDEWLNRTSLPADLPIAHLSGGWRKRVALARALVGDPDLLLLDEPTNHLDVESIIWLERLLAQARFATITVTHDRLFLQRVANRILELDRRNAGGIMNVAGDYATYIERKAEAMANQERREEALRNSLRRETEWLRRGPAARTTKQQARIQRAGTLASDVAELQRRNRVSSVDIDFQATDETGAAAPRPKRLIEARDIAKQFDGRTIFAGVNLFIGPGTRLGLLGPNGCGKSTLLRVLTGLDLPTSGTVLRADSLRVATFDQNRDALDPTASVADSVCPDGDFVSFRGTRLHRHGYLERFLFRTEQVNQPVGRLSGGEQSRLLLARLMLQPANLLVLDEPTNDLDLQTLTILEESLGGFEGAVLLVSHDRYFLDQVATEILAFHTNPGEEGRVSAFASLGQWEAWHGTQGVRRGGTGDGSPTTDGGKIRSTTNDQGGLPSGSVRKKKLGFKDQQDWNTLEARILEREARLAALEEESAQPEIVSDAARVVALEEEKTRARSEIDRLYGRWAELEAMLNG